MDREAWHAVIHGVTNSRTRLSDWIELNWMFLSRMFCCSLFALLFSVCHADITFISIMVLFFSSLFLLPRPLIVFKSIVLLLLLNEATILWPPDAKSQLIRKDPYAGRDWRQEEKGTTEEEMIEWHHRFNGQEFEQTGWCWRTGKPGILQSMGFQRIGHDCDWTTIHLFEFLKISCFI